MLDWYMLFKSDREKCAARLTTVRPNSIRVVGTDKGDITEAAIAELQASDV